MIYQCYKCKKLFKENDGAMVLNEQTTSSFPIPEDIEFLVFKCKDCIGKKGKEAIERLEKERK